MTRPKIGLALGGGAARGWAHIGVLRALDRAGFRPDIIAGTSIGAVAGGCYAADKLDHLEDFARSLTPRRVFRFLDFNFGGSGIISGGRLGEALVKALEDRTIEGLDSKFVAVATELRTGHEIWLTKGPMVSALRASYALPGIFKPVQYNGRWLIDGALVNPIPVSVCRALGARVVIAVNLHADVFTRGSVIPDDEIIGQINELESLETQVPKGNGRAAKHLLHRQFLGRGADAPGISSVMMDAFNITQDRIARSRLAGDPPDILLGMRLGHVGLFEFHRAEEAIAIGEEATSRVLEEVERSLLALA